jgi:hypothetical protein
MVKKKTVKKSEKIETSEKKSSKMKINYWMIVSVVLAILLLINGLVALTSGISKSEAEEIFVEFAQEQGADVEIVSVEKVGKLYEIKFSIENQEMNFHMTMDGKYAGNMFELEPKEALATGDVVSDTPTQTISECANEKGILEDTIIFYYSDSCGWCARMKPGVASLVERGYNILSANAAEQNPLVDECIIPHMTSGGVPQFICVKTGEIKVGAFADAEGNLDQVAMDAWVDNCLAN